jgi:hypothetical protein
MWAELGAVEDALALLGEVVETGFACSAGLRCDPLFDLLRPEPEFGALLERAEAAAGAAAVAFRAAGGPALLGVTDP